MDEATNGLPASWLKKATITHALHSERLGSFSERFREFSEGLGSFSE